MAAGSTRRQASCALAQLVIEPFLPPLYDDYDVHPDGRTLVLVQPASGTPVRELSMILNWPEELKRLAPDR